MYAPHPGGAAGSPDGGAMRRIFAAVLLTLPLTGCVFIDHDHGRWGGPHRYGYDAPAPGYYGGPHPDWRR